MHCASAQLQMFMEKQLFSLIKATQKRGVLSGLWCNDAGGSMGSYEGTLIWRFRLFFFDGEILSCVSFLIKVFHKLTVHFHYCCRRHSQFSSGSPQATLCFDQRPTRDTDAGPESLNTHTWYEGFQKRHINENADVFVFP